MLGQTTVVCSDGVLDVVCVSSCRDLKYFIHHDNVTASCPSAATLQVGKL